MFLEISQNSQENTCTRVQACNSIKKKFWHRWFTVNFPIFLRTLFFTKHLWTTASEFVTDVLIFRSSRSQIFFKIGALKNFAILESPFLIIKLQAFFYRKPTVVAAANTFFAAEYGIYCWQWHRFLVWTPLKTRVKLQM